MLSSHFIGEITEQQVALEFLKQGILISKPLVQSSRYDFIADINGKLYKIQVKTGTFKEDSYLIFATSTSHTNTKGTLNLSYSAQDVDFFASHFSGNELVLEMYGTGRCRTKTIYVDKDIKDKITENTNNGVQYF